MAEAVIAHFGRPFGSHLIHLDSDIDLKMTSVLF